ncbi:MAG: phenylalanine--tRNA ligase subunit beta [Candidatus Nitrosocosmicus sp.]
MPVVKVRLSRLSNSFPNISLNEIIDKLPYVGLDIEGIDKEDGIIRVEFNPNRPDFASENGILRALDGLFEIETGLPIKGNVKESDYTINVDNTIGNIRPFIYGVVGKRENSVDEFELSQLISIQEVLHNGLGRKRKKSSIGLHDLNSIVFPLDYNTVSKSFSFVPLDKQHEFTIENILIDMDVGKTYAHIINSFDRVPILFDSKKNVLSFPPIINGNASKLTLDTKNLFIEVTSTSKKTAQDILSILCFELFDMGFQIYCVNIKSPYENIIKSPNLAPLKMMVTSEYINNILGLDLSIGTIIKCLGKSRCLGRVSDNGIECMIPRYRIDVNNPVDISEEVALGYGIYNFIPSAPSLYISGKKHVNSLIFDNIREILVGLGFIEIINTNMISAKILNSFFIDTKNILDDIVSIADSKASDFEFLRNSIIPSMMMTLSKNIHEKYPQKLFEIGKTFKIQNSEIKEEWHLGVIIAHNNTDYSEIKSVLESLMKYCFNKNIKTPYYTVEYYMKGHSARILLDEHEIGDIGEIYPLVLENFRLRTMVTTFNINLNLLINLLDIRKLKYI